MMTRLASRFFVPLSIAASGLASAALAAPEPRTPVVDKPKAVYCAWFGPDGNTKYSACWRKPLSEATKECNDQLKAKKVEGSCDCTDDQAFINGRCG